MNETYYVPTIDRLSDPLGLNATVSTIDAHPVYGRALFVFFVVFALYAAAIAIHEVLS